MLFPPELFILVGVNVFVALSLLTSIFDGSSPMVAPYIFQIAALAGFGQIWVGYAFLFSFIEARFWCSLLYLSVSLMAVMAVNLYIAIKKKPLSAAGALLGAFTIPTISISLLFVSSYVNGLAVSMPLLPIVPVESLYIVFVACTVILGLSIAVYYEPSVLKRMLKMGKKEQHTSRLLNPTLNPADGPKEHKKERR